MKAASDENVYQRAIKVTGEEMKKINLIREDFNGEWNFKINPS